MDGTTTDTDRCGLKPDRFDAIVKILKQIAQKNGIQNLKIELTPGCEKGDGFMGEKNRCTLKGDNKSLQVFVKGAPTEESLRLFNDGAIRKYYLIEIAIYDDIYPAYLKFQEERKVEKPFKGILDIIATSSEFNQEILIMPDANELGFHLWDRKKQMNLNHVEIIFKEYGKFHACSYALKEQKPELFQNLIDKFPIDPFVKMVQDCTVGLTDLANNAKKLFDPVKEKKILDRFCEFSEEMLDVMQSTIENDEFAVLTHGDCWCNNMLFKYPPNNPDHSTPCDVCLLDFQLARIGSPVMDLSYFLYSSACASTYKDLDHLLHVYHTSLSTHLRALGSNPDNILTFSELKQQWKDYCNFGLLLGMLLMKIMLMDKEEAVDVSEVLDTSDDILSGFTKKSKNDDLYLERLKALLEHIYEHNLFKRLEK